MCALTDQPPRAQNDGASRSVATSTIATAVTAELVQQVGASISTGRHVNHCDRLNVMPFQAMPLG
jgi:hypothetical protein